MLVLENYRSFGYGPVTCSVTVYQADGVTPRDLTGETITMDIKKTYEDPAAFLSLSSGSGLTITPATGLIEIALTAPQVTSLFGYPWIFDIKSVEGLAIYTVSAGSILVKDTVTH